MGKILISWLGNADINSLSIDSNSAQGPLDTILHVDYYDQVYLLNNQAKTTVSPLIQTLTQRYSSNFHPQTLSRHIGGARPPRTYHRR